MTGSASRRKPLWALGSLQLGSSALETSDRRRQDKSRKVRTVGSIRNTIKFRLVANIANVVRNLLFSATRYRSSTFHTLRGSHER
jgi:hypothetical protein